MKRLYQFFFTIFYIMYLEIILAKLLFIDSLSKSFGYILIFTIVIALFIQILTHLFSEKVNKIIYLALMVFLIIIYCSQLVFYSIYGTFFSLLITNQAADLGSFLDFISGKILDNWVGILLMSVPFVLFIIFRKAFEFKKMDKYTFAPYAIVFLCCLIISTSVIQSTKSGLNSIYSLFYEKNQPSIAVSKMGLLTSMTSEMSKNLRGYKETVLVFEETSSEENNDREEKENNYNMMDIDFNELINSESDDILKSMHKYFKSVSPTKKNQYTGMFEGKNVVVFLAEAFHTIALDEEVTPTLYKLSNEGFTFNNFYTPLYYASTSGGEYVSRTSLLPKNGVLSMKTSQHNYLPFTLANSLRDVGYSTRAYHNHLYDYYSRDESHLNLGYDSYMGCGNGLEEIMNCSNWTNSDEEMLKATVPHYTGKDTPFLSYYVTISGHLGYTQMVNKSVSDNYDLVSDLPYSYRIKGYLASHTELDRAVQHLIETLKATDQLDNTVIIIGSDHYPYGLNADEVQERSDYEVDENFEIHRNSLIIWNSEMTEQVNVDKYASSLDLLPTLLNLFGVEYDSRLLIGKDMFSNSEGVVTFQNRSWITEYGKYNSLTSEFTPFKEMNDVEEYVNEINRKIDDDWLISTLVLDNDYYRIIFEKQFEVFSTND